MVVKVSEVAKGELFAFAWNLGPLEGRRRQNVVVHRMDCYHRRLDGLRLDSLTVSSASPMAMSNTCLASWTVSRGTFGHEASMPQVSG